MSLPRCSRCRSSLRQQVTAEAGDAGVGGVPAIGAGGSRFVDARAVGCRRSALVVETVAAATFDAGFAPAAIAFARIERGEGAVVSGALFLAGEEERRMAG